MSKKVFLRIWDTSIHWHFNSPLESTNSCLSKAKRKYILYIFKAVFVMSKKSFFFLQKYMLGICKGRTRFTLHCAHIHIFQLALRKEFLQRKIGKCEFCNRARRNLVIYEIVSLREQSHHLKYTKQSLKMILIYEYLLQTSQELRMLSRSLSVYQCLLVSISVYQSLLVSTSVYQCLLT